MSAKKSKQCFLRVASIYPNLEITKGDLCIWVSEVAYKASIAPAVRNHFTLSTSHAVQYLDHYMPSAVYFSNFLSLESFLKFTLLAAQGIFLKQADIAVHNSVFLDSIVRSYSAHTIPDTKFTTFLGLLRF